MTIRGGGDPSQAWLARRFREWACRLGALPPMRMTASWSGSQRSTEYKCVGAMFRAQGRAPLGSILGNVTVTIDNQASHAQSTYRHRPDEPGRASSPAPCHAAPAKLPARSTIPTPRPTADTLVRSGGRFGRSAAGISQLAGEPAAKPRKLEAGGQAPGDRRTRPRGVASGRSTPRLRSGLTQQWSLTAKAPYKPDPKAYVA
jgi:hypothetical protein